LFRTGKCLLQAQQRLRRDTDATGLAKPCDIIGRIVFPIVKRPSSQPFLFDAPIVRSLGLDPFYTPSGIEITLHASRGQPG
jgi:hypothetical protein